MEKAMASAGLRLLGMVHTAWVRCPEAGLGLAAKWHGSPDPCLEFGHFGTAQAAGTGVPIRVRSLAPMLCVEDGGYLGARD